MDEVNTAIKWSSVLEEFFKDMGEKSYCYAYLHKQAEASFGRKRNFIDLPVIILSTIAGTLSISRTAIFPASYEAEASIFIGILSLLVGILNTVGTYFSFAKRSEEHRSVYLQYSKLYRFIDIELSLPREERIRPSDLLKVARENYERLSEISPLIPNSIIVDFQTKFKSIDVAKPSETNGLESIKIYTPSTFSPSSTSNASKTSPLSLDIALETSS